MRRARPSYHRPAQKRLWSRLLLCNPKRRPNLRRRQDGLQLFRIHPPMAVGRARRAARSIRRRPPPPQGRPAHRHSRQHPARQPHSRAANPGRPGRQIHPSRTMRPERRITQQAPRQPPAKRLIGPARPAPRTHRDRLEVGPIHPLPLHLRAATGPIPVGSNIPRDISPINHTSHTTTISRDPNNVR